MSHGLPTVLPLLGLDGIVLKSGAHENRAAGVCLLEAVAWVAGEAHSDHPACACPVMAAFGRRLNDRIREDDIRTSLLRPIVTLLVGSKSTPAIEFQRVYLAVDWSVRVITPEWLELSETLKPHADALRALPELVDRQSAEAALPIIRAARSAAAAYADAAAAAAYADAYAAAAYAAAADVYADAANAYAHAAAYAADAADAYAHAAAYAADAARTERARALRDAQRFSAVDLLKRMATITEGGC